MKRHESPHGCDHRDTCPPCRSRRSPTRAPRRNEGRLGAPHRLPTGREALRCAPRGPVGHGHATRRRLEHARVEVAADAADAQHVQERRPCALAHLRPTAVLVQMWQRASQVLVQMWQRRAQSRCRCGRGEPSLGADAAGASPVLVQMRPCARCIVARRILHAICCLFCTCMSHVASLAPA